jgi:hypothetical protein
VTTSNSQPESETPVVLSARDSGHVKRHAEITDRSRNSLMGGDMGRTSLELSSTAVMFVGEGEQVVTR